MAMSMAARSATLFSRISPLPHPRPLFSRRHFSRSTTIVPPSNLGVVSLAKHTAYVVERFRKYHKTLTDPGWHFLIPFIDRVAHVYDLEWPDSLANNLHFTPADQSVVVSLAYGLSYQFVDPKLAAYTVKDPTLETQRAMEDKLASEILSSFDSPDRLLEDKHRRLLCKNAVRAANAETTQWGVKCLMCALTLPSITPEVIRSKMGEIKLTQVLKVA